MSKFATIMLVWLSGDKDRLLEVWSSGEYKIKKTGGVRSRDRVRGVNSVRDRDRVRAGGDCVILFEKQPPTPLPEKMGKSPS